MKTIEQSDPKPIKKKDSLQRGEPIVPKRILKKFHGDIYKSEEQELEYKDVLQSRIREGNFLKKKRQ